MKRLVIVLIICSFNFAQAGEATRIGEWIGATVAGTLLGIASLGLIFNSQYCDSQICSYPVMAAGHYMYKGYAPKSSVKLFCNETGVGGFYLINSQGQPEVNVTEDVLKKGFFTEKENVYTQDQMNKICQDKASNAFNEYLELVESKAK